MKSKQDRRIGQSNGSSNSQPKRRGRPPGSKNQNDFARVPAADVQSPRCQMCDSSKMSIVHSITRRLQGTFNGKPFDSVVWRRCKCMTCGNVQIVKLFLYGE